MFKQKNKLILSNKDFHIFQIIIFGFNQIFNMESTTIPDKKQPQFQALFENYIDNLQNSTINKRELFSLS